MLAIRACILPPVTLYPTPPWLLQHTSGLCHGTTQPAVQGPTAGDAAARPVQVPPVPVTHFLGALPDSDTQRVGQDLVLSSILRRNFGRNTAISETQFRRRSAAIADICGRKCAENTYVRETSCTRLQILLFFTILSVHPWSIQ